ncbi:hypothetical protein ABRY23_04970 [Melioribacteraceae bacterium 4301-Me]|uniref:hypothetical protein n=1 Tax=Pyranulibacter aquaticus TaxID=3163344 RepID=UPI003594F43E
MRNKKIILLFLITLFAQNINKAQLKNPVIGASLGGGEIRGNSNGLSAFSGEFFTGSSLWFSNDVQFRVGFIFSRKVEYFLPENRLGKYYPFIKVIYLKAVINQQLNDLLFVEEGAGILTINDRIFVDTNVWDYGAGFHVLLGLDFTSPESTGIKVSSGIDSGVTFNNTSANYFLFIVQLQYML